MPATSVLRATTFLFWIACLHIPLSQPAQAQSPAPEPKFVHVMAWEYLGAVKADSVPTSNRSDGSDVLRKREVPLGLLVASNDKEIVVRDLDEQKITRFPRKTLAYDYTSTMVTGYREVTEDFNGYLIKKRVPDQRKTVVVHGERQTPLVIELQTYEVARSLGVPEYVALRVFLATPSGSDAGRVVRIDGGTIYVSLGSAHGVTLDQELMLFRGEEEIKDPVTGEVLGKERRQLASLGVTEVHERYSKARLQGNFEVPVAVGDEVEPEVKKYSVAVLPLVSNGTVLPTLPTKIAEDLTTALVARRVSVVERNLREEVLKNLRKEQNADFDAESVRKLGRQLGATFVVVGTITGNHDPSARQNAYSVHVRLVKSETGESLFATAFSYQTWTTNNGGTYGLAR